MLDPSLPCINCVLLFLVSHLSSILYLFLLQPVFFSLSLFHLCSLFLSFSVSSLFFSFSMDSYPSSQTSKFVELLNSQQSISFGNYEDSVSLSSSQAPYLRNLGTEDGGETGTERRERRKWTPCVTILYKAQTLLLFLFAFLLINNFYNHNQSPFSFYKSLSISAKISKITNKLRSLSIHLFLYHQQFLKSQTISILFL